MKKRLTKKDIFTIPNGLSLFRILLVPVIVWLYGTSGKHYAALGVVALSGLTDIADGYIARHFNMISDVGKVLDPIADKLTQAALLMCLATRYGVLYWLFALFVVKELMQGVFGYMTLKLTDTVNSARWYGKVSTGVFYGVMMALILFDTIPLTWAYVLIGLCAAALVMSMILYARYYMDILWNNLFPGIKRWSFLIVVFAVLITAAIVLFCWTHRAAVTVDGILRVTPHNLLLAVLLLLALFAVKSLTIVVYCGILYAASGILFPLPLAITVNLAGTTIMALVPYFLGKKLGEAAKRRIEGAYPNSSAIEKLRTNNEFFFTFLLRAISILPMDLVSIYLGAEKTTPVPYVLGSVAGMAPSCVLFPILGMSVMDVRSPQFIIAASIELVLVVVSLAVYLVIRKRTVNTTEGQAR